MNFQSEPFESFKKESSTGKAEDVREFPPLLDSDTWPPRDPDHLEEIVMAKLRNLGKRFGPGDKETMKQKEALMRIALQKYRNNLKNIKEKEPNNKIVVEMALSIFEEEMKKILET
jgi:hypothetical protein